MASTSEDGVAGEESLRFWRLAEVWSGVVGLALEAAARCMNYMELVCGLDKSVEEVAHGGCTFMVMSREDIVLGGLPVGVGLDDIVWWEGCGSGPVGLVLVLIVRVHCA